MREKRYQEALQELSSVLADENDFIASLANCSALLKTHLNFFWIGFYRVLSDARSGSKELVLGPFQGSLACTRIAFGKGVCGKSWQEGKTIRVSNVHEFPGHIACSSLSNSEIVIPIKSKQSGDVVAVLDIDSTEYDDFSELDQRYLEKVASLIGEKF